MGLLAIQGGRIGKALIVWLLAFLISLLAPGVVGCLNANAGAVQALAAIVVAALTLALVATTIYYAKKKSDIAQSTRESVKVSEGMIAEGRRQSVLAQVPVFSVTALPSQGPARMDLAITNTSDVVPVSPVVSAKTMWLRSEFYPTYSLGPTPIDPLAPHREYKLRLAQGPGALRRPLVIPIAVLKVIITYQNVLGVPFEQHFRLTLTGSLVRPCRTEPGVMEMEHRKAPTSLQPR